MKMQMGQDYSFVARCGLSWNFKTGEPQEIPTKLVREVMAAGCYLVEDKEVAEKEMALVNAEKQELNERVPKIEAAIRKMVERNRRGDFTAGGRPNLNTLYRETELEVDSAELEPIWNRVRKEFE